MAQRANTPIELWPKLLNLLGDIKLAALATGQPDQLQNAIQIETTVLEMLKAPLQQMQGGGGQPMGMTPVAASPGAPMSIPSAGRAAIQGNPFGAPGAPGGAPNLDELRRILPG